MVSSEKEYLDAMRDMIRKVQGGYEPPFSADAEELEILADCIRQGYLLGTTTYVDQNGHNQELRTLDGKMHPELINHVIPPKGLAFLNATDASDDLSKESDKPDTAHSAKSKGDTGKKFYKSGVFWAAAAVVVSIVLWFIDRFILGK